MTEDDTQWPETVEDAARFMLARMSKKDRKMVRETAEEDLIDFHFGWAMDVRAAVGLWDGNKALLQDSGCWSADDCSMKIIERSWQILQEEDE